MYATAKNSIQAGSPVCPLFYLILLLFNAYVELIVHEITKWRKEGFASQSIVT